MVFLLTNLYTFACALSLSGAYALLQRERT